jgi:hypothetical protein
MNRVNFLVIVFLAVILLPISTVFAQTVPNPESFPSDSLIYIEKTKPSNKNPIDDFIALGKAAGFFKTGKMVENDQMKDFVLADPPVYFVFKQRKAKGWVDDLRASFTFRSKLGRFKQIMKEKYKVVKDDGQIVELGSELAPYYFETEDHLILIIRTYIPKFFLDAVHFGNTGGDSSFVDQFDESRGEKVFFAPGGEMPEMTIDYEYSVVRSLPGGDEKIRLFDVDLDTLFSKSKLEAIVAGKSRDADKITSYVVECRLWDALDISTTDDSWMTPHVLK